MMRRAILIYSLLCLLIGAVLLLTVHAVLAVALYLVINGAIIASTVLVTRRGHRPAVDRSRGVWEATGERFVDPTSRRVLEVHYNAETGERNYVLADTPTAGSESRDET